MNIVRVRVTLIPEHTLGVQLIPNVRRFRLAQRTTYVSIVIAWNMMPVVELIWKCESRSIAANIIILVVPRDVAFINIAPIRALINVTF